MMSSKIVGKLTVENKDKFTLKKTRYCFQSSITRQSELLGVARILYYLPKINKEELAIKQQIQISIMRYQYMDT